MDQHDTLSAPDLSQEQLSTLIGLVRQAAGSPYATYGTFDPDKIWVSASSGALDDTGRIGNLVIQENPQYDPAAFLAVRHLERGVGDDRNETQALYTFSSDMDGLLSMQASDVISGDHATQLLLDAAEFDNSVKDHPDKEMVATAQADMRKEIHEAASIEAMELMATLKPADDAGYERLMTLVQTALNGDQHQSEAEREHEAWWEGQQQADARYEASMSHGRVRRSFRRIVRGILGS